MTVVVLTACPPGLRGQLTRWLLEIAPGVFVGHVPARVRDLLWTRIVELVGRGRAIMVHNVQGEQRLGFLVHGHDWTPVDFDGIQLMLRPLPDSRETAGQGPRSVGSGGPPKNWSSAARRRRYASQSRRQALENSDDE